MEEEHAVAVQQQQVHDSFNAYNAHSGYLDSAQAQTLATFFPDFAHMDPASQAMAMQQYAHLLGPDALQSMEHGGMDQRQHRLPASETESDIEEGVDAAQHRLTIASVDAQATKGDEAWTEEEEQELVRLVNDEMYRKVCVSAWSLVFQQRMHMEK